MNRSLNLALVPLLAAMFFALGLSRPVRAEESAGTYTVVRHVLRVSTDGEVMSEETSRLTSSFVVSGNRWAPASLPLQVSYNPAGEAPGVSGVRELIQESIGAWNAVSPASFSFVYGEESSAHPGSCDSKILLDGINTIKFTEIAGDTLGLTCTVFFGNAADAKLVEFDMLLSNKDGVWATSPVTPMNRFDLPTTILHELGHAAGLGHSNEPESVMNSTLSTGAQQRSLGADDIAGLKAAYPVAAVAGASAAGPASAAAGSPAITRGPFRLRAAFVSYD